MNIRIAGFGGQGVVMAGYVLGKGGILDGRNALQTQSYGSESRGGACKSDVVICDDEIVELAPSVLDVLIVMAQPALDRYLRDLKDDGTLIYDDGLVKTADLRIPAPRGCEHDPADAGGTPGPTAIPPTSPKCSQRVFGLPATEIADKTLGQILVANMIMLGCLASLTGVVSPDALRLAIAESVPAKTVDLNLQAFKEGYARGGI